VRRLTSRTNGRARGVALSVDTTLRGGFALRDGTPALIWPLLPSDARMLRVGFRQLSPQSRRSRFLSPLNDLDEAMIERLVGGVDGVHHVALVLVVLPPDGLEQPAGVARLIQDRSDPATADIAVTVADQWQGRGVGAALVRALMQRRPPGLRRIHTVVDADNQASLALLGGAGRMSSSVTRRGVVDVTVDLPAA
jgi:RimJ/RimL family protein N-acetyltransferase